MRPVDKWIPGKVELPNGTNIDIPKTFDDYKKAKPFLVLNIGCICSYCEKKYAEKRDIEVEHVQPKKYKDNNGHYIYAHLEKEWSNFLLSCATCNGADNKDTKNVVLKECHLPHLNNTFLSLNYDMGGVVTVNPALTGLSKQHAENLLNLVGLNKGSVDSRNGDTRWKTRYQQWNLATKYLSKYQSGKSDVDTIIDLVKGYGCWSIWFTVFKGYDEVRKALIDEFPGTAKNCFDPHNHYEPVPRNPMNEDDPV